MSSDAVAPTAGSPHADEARHFRGSTVLLLGRFVGIGLDLATQVIIVRALSRTEFGAFAFGLSVASLSATIALLGLDKTIARFAPMYEEAGDGRRLAGSVLLSFGLVAAVCAAMIVGLLGLQLLAGGEVVENQLAREMLLVLFLLTPVRAFDSLMTATFAVFGSARSIALRRHVVAPGLQLLVVLLVAVADQPPLALAVGYVLAGFLGLGLFATILYRQLRDRGIIDRIRRRDVDVPVRAILGFSLPLLSSDVVFLLRTSAIVIMLQYFSDSFEVAAYGAVLPIARQTLIVDQAFAFLFVPVSTRLFARGEHERLRSMYWGTAVWIAVATFPAVAATTALAEPITVLLFGDAYRDAAAVLAILAIGLYVSAAVGFNALTLRVQGSVRFIVAVDAIAAAVSVGASLVLLEPYGATGAAVVMSLTLIVQNALYQIGLVRSGVGRPDLRHVLVFVAVAVLLVALILLQANLHLSLIVGLAVIGMVWLGLIVGSRRALELGRYFPELARIPVVRWLVGATAPDVDGGKERDA
ncbi:MAG TPA: oligosaccharide flippase family protein [Candidatus Limnocylindrales bacterium]